MRSLLIAGLLLITSGPALAAEAGLRVSTSILPLQELVRTVMHDPAMPTATPDLILPPGASPHAYALKPSEARALASADVIFRVGPQLEAFLDRPLANLAANAVRVDLIDAPGMILLPVREDADFEGHEHGNHDDHEKGNHDQHEAHEDHDDDHDGDHADDHDAHAHAGEHPEHVDPHIWLHPANAIAMVRQIAHVLSEAAPKQAVLYQANAERAIARLQAAATRFEADWKTLRAAQEAVPFVVFHDSLHYFEHWSGLESSGSITLNPEVPPGALHMRELRTRMAAKKVRCVFVEPQLDGRIARQIAKDAGLSVHIVDPIGDTVTDGTAHAGSDGFSPLIAGIRDALAACHHKHLH